MKGDGLLGVDLSRAKIVAKDDTSKRATIELPLPELLTSRVDHSRTQTWQVRKTAWMPWSGDGDKLRDQVMREAQKLVAQAATSSEYMAQSKMAAEAIIEAFYWEVGVERGNEVGGWRWDRSASAVGKVRIKSVSASVRRWRQWVRTG